MFTGIVEEIGSIAAVQSKGTYARLSIKGALVLEDLSVGDSVAVNGVCLTTAELGHQLFHADVMNETLARTGFSELRAGQKVNLERAMRADGRFGGHIVSGHIDGTGKIIARKSEGNAVWVTVAAPEDLMKYIALKGSVAIDGISLTVAKLTAEDFSVSLIPHTGKATTLLEKKTGDTVNLETDLLAKYVGRLLAFGSVGERGEKAAAGIGAGGLTAALLAQAGF